MLRYHLARDGRSLGIMEQVELVRALQAGELRAEDLSWCEGESAWSPLRSRPWAAAFIPALTGPTLERVGRPLYRRILPTLRDVLLAPTRTFTPGSDTLPILPALGWHLALATVANLLGLLWAQWFFRSYWMQARSLSQGLLPDWSEAFHVLMLWALATPLLVLIGAFAVPFAVQSLLRLVRGGGGGWRATFRVLNYTGGAVHLLLAIPFVGFLAAPWGFACTLPALAAAHRTSGRRVAAAFALAAFLMLGSLLLSLLMVWFAFSTQLI